jgi:hypothetical protein
VPFSHFTIGDKYESTRPSIAWSFCYPVTRSSGLWEHRNAVALLGVYRLERDLKGIRFFHGRYASGFVERDVVRDIAEAARRSADKVYRLIDELVPLLDKESRRMWLEEEVY